MIDATLPEPAFTGWLREGKGHWRAVVTGRSSREAWGYLLAYKHSHKVADMVVTPSSENPNFRTRVK
jgi:hypothetical protein